MKGYLISWLHFFLLTFFSFVILCEIISRDAALDYTLSMLSCDAELVE